MAFSQTHDRSGGNWFERVVDLNEASKLLLHQSFHVNLLALDATVQSKRGQGNVRGFEEVSSQMRAWSRELDTKLKQLGGLSAAVVGRASLAAKEAHALALLSEALRLSSDASVSEAHGRVGKEFAASARLMARDWGLIRDLVGDLDLLGMTACVLSRSAMIEACSAGPELRDQLGHVSREFYANSHAAVNVLKALSKAMRRP